MMCATAIDSLSQTKRRITKPKDTASQISDRGAATATPICQITVEQFPAIRGFRLGMTLAEVKRRFISGFDELRADRFGVLTVSLSVPASITFPVAVNPHEFTGVFQLQFTFYEGRLIEIRYEYAPAKWRNIREFLSMVSPALNIDVKQWEVTDTGSATLACTGFAVHARLSAFSSKEDMPQITVTDTVAKAEVSKRKSEAISQSEEDRRRTFRP